MTVTAMVLGCRIFAGNFSQGVARCTPDLRRSSASCLFLAQDGEAVSKTEERQKILSVCKHPCSQYVSLINQVAISW